MADIDTSGSAGPVRLSFHGGMVGALLPFGAFLAGVTWLGLLGAPSEKGFWPILVGALLLGLGLAKDRQAWCEAAIGGMSRPVVMMMIMAWLLAGVLGSLMGASGFVDSLIFTADAIGLEGGGYCVAAFLICCVVSTSTGTSLGTVILCAPLLYPAGGALLAEPAILMGAILGGATFGDNISPVSDTTIASSVTQRADMSGVVRSRLRYALPAAAVALVIYGLLGGAEPATQVDRVAPAPSAESAVGSETSPGNEAAEARPAASPRGLPMLLAPAVVLFLLLRRRHLIHGLLVGIAVASGVGLVTGLLQPEQLFHVDAASFSARGLLVDGLEKGVGVSVFTLLLMGLVAGIESAGVVERAVGFAESRARSAAGAERWIFAAVSAAALLITHATVAILTVGDFARRMGSQFGISRFRRANILDVTVCSWPHIFPWFIPAILTASTTASGEGYGMPRLTSVDVGLANAHSWALLLMALLAVGVGYGRDSQEGQSGEAQSQEGQPRPEN